MDFNFQNNLSVSVWLSPHILMNALRKRAFLQTIPKSTRTALGADFNHAKVSVLTLAQNPSRSQKGAPNVVADIKEGSGEQEQPKSYTLG